MRKKVIQFPAKGRRLPAGDEGALPNRDSRRRRALSNGHTARPRRYQLNQLQVLTRFGRAVSASRFEAIGYLQRLFGGLAAGRRRMAE
jgi:hypothetical protein